MRSPSRRALGRQVASRAGPRCGASHAASRQREKFSRERAKRLSFEPRGAPSMEVDPPPAAPAPAEPGSAPAVAPAPVAPRRIGHWQVEKQIGRGSFAVVWRARHAETGQRVAVKEIRLDKLNRKLRESLESEIQVLQRSRHGNIIRLHDIIKEEKRIFLRQVTSLLKQEHNNLNCTVLLMRT